MLEKRNKKPPSYDQMPSATYGSAAAAAHLKRYDLALPPPSKSGFRQQPVVQFRLFQQASPVYKAQPILDVMPSRRSAHWYSIKSRRPFSDSNLASPSAAASSRSSKLTSTQSSHDVTGSGSNSSSNSGSSTASAPGGSLVPWESNVELHRDYISFNIIHQRMSVKRTHVPESGETFYSFALPLCYASNYMIEFRWQRRRKNNWVFSVVQNANGILPVPLYDPLALMTDANVVVPKMVGGEAIRDHWILNSNALENVLLYTGAWLCCFDPELYATLRARRQGNGDSSNANSSTSTSASDTATTVGVEPSSCGGSLFLRRLRRRSNSGSSDFSAAPTSTYTPTLAPTLTHSVSSRSSTPTPPASYANSIHSLDIEARSPKTIAKTTKSRESDELESSTRLNFVLPDMVRSSTVSRVTNGEGGKLKESPSRRRRRLLGLFAF